MNILITGCAGFIGSALWSRWASKYRLIGIDDLSRPTSNPPIIDSLQHHLFFREDILNVGNLPLPKLDFIVHLAGQVSVVASLSDPIRDSLVNCHGTLLLCLLAKRHGCPLIYSSTNKVFGELTGVTVPIKDSTPLNPQTPYGVSKSAGASYVLDLLPNNGFVFHQSCIYGSSQVGTLDQGWIGWLRGNIKSNNPITCFGNGKQVRDLLNVEDLLDLYQIALEGHMPSGAYVTGGGVENSYTFEEVVGLLGGSIKKYDAWRDHDQRHIF